MKTDIHIKFYKIVSYLLMLGVIHSALTPFFYDFFSPDGMWFFGTGLSLLFLSLLNISASRLLDLWMLKLTLFANIVGTGFSFIIVLVLNETQAYVGLVFNLVVLIANILVLQTLNKEYETLK